MRSWGTEDDVLRVLGPIPLTAEQAGRRVMFTRASDVQAEPIRWLWEGRIPLGALTTVAGMQGLGKSTMTAWLAARVSRGDLPGNLSAAPATALIVTLEDHLASVVKPRLTAAGADLDLVEFVTVNVQGGDDLVTLPEDIEKIGSRVAECAARLLVVDPIVATLSGAIDGYKDQHVRRALAPLAQLAERHGLAVVGVMHLNKQQAGDVLNRVGGSGAFTAAPRSVLFFARDPDDPDDEDGDRRIVVPIKGNWGRLAPSLVFRHETHVVTDNKAGAIETNRLAVVGESNVTKADLAGADPTERREQLDAAADWLGEYLQDGAWHEAKHVTRDGKAAGHSRSTLYRARNAIHVEGSERAGFQGPTSWRLPVVSPPPRAQIGDDSKAPANTEDSRDPSLSRSTPANVRRLGVFAADCVNATTHADHHHPHPDAGRPVCHICHTPAAVLNGTLPDRAEAVA